MRASTAMMFSGAVLAAAAASLNVQAAQCDWPAYRLFIERVVQADGRVVDRSTEAQQTTSEGQSYGMFFALVANDRASFDRMLNWSRANLSANQFDTTNLRLPAWQWGKKPDGSFGVMDANSASDADLWIAYDLFQAGRLWKEPSYTKLAYALATQIIKQEMVDLPGLGPMLLPGPQGFRTGDVTRLNPSYLPLPLLRALAHEMPDGPWAKLAQSAERMVKITAPRGYSPDWVAYKSGQFVVDPKNGDIGSYDAIRVYLWAGMTSLNDPLARGWLDALGGMRQSVAQNGYPPEKVSTISGAISGEGPISYWAALAPYFKSLNDERGLGLARTHLDALNTPNAAREPVYYDRVLGLFGGGFIEGKFRFDDNGRLVPNWRGAC
jgi:endoglucanase